MKFYSTRKTVKNVIINIVKHAGKSCIKSWKRIDSAELVQIVWPDGTKNYEVNYRWNGREETDLETNSYKEALKLFKSFCN